MEFPDKIVIVGTVAVLAGGATWLNGDYRLIVWPMLILEYNILAMALVGLGGGLILGRLMKRGRGNGH